MVAISKDAGVEIVDTIRLSITGECNLNCFYCKPLGRNGDLSKPKRSILPSDVSKLMKVVGDLGIRKVIIEGGEPLLRKDASSFVKAAFAHKKVDNVRLVTNGTFLKAFADSLRKFGLRKVDVNFNSLNFIKYQRITNSDSLYRVLDGIEKVEKLNYSEIRLNVLLLDGINNEEIIHFARMVKDRRVNLRFIEYAPITNDGDPYAQRSNGLTVLEAKRTIDNYQKLTQVDSWDGDEEVPTFAFGDSVGRISFMSRQKVEQERAAPRVLFTPEGALLNEQSPKRSLDLLEDLRREPKSLKLRKAIEKILMTDAALMAPKSKKLEEVASKSKAKGKVVLTAAKKAAAPRHSARAVAVRPSGQKSRARVSASV